MRGSARIQLPACGESAGRAVLTAGLIHLSLTDCRLRRIPDRQEKGRIPISANGSDWLLTDNNTNKVLYTGDPGWQVFATGIDFDNNSAPTLAQINAQIVIANNNSGPPGSSSVSWVGPSPQNGTNGFLAVGGFNGDPSFAPPAVVCQSQFPKGSGPRWMWYSDAPGVDVFQNQPTVNNGPFSTVGRGGWREFLIFRMPVQQFQPEVGILKVCKVAGPGVAVGTLVNFTAGSIDPTTDC